MLNLALIPKQQELKSPSSLTHKIYSHPQNHIFFFLNTHTEKKQRERKTEFSITTLLNISTTLLLQTRASVDTSAMAERNSTENKDNGKTDERLCGRSSSSLVLHYWSWGLTCKHTQKPCVTTGSVCQKPQTECLISPSVLTLTTGPWIRYGDLNSCWQLAYPMPSPRPEPNDTGHVRPTGGGGRTLHFKKEIFQEKNIDFLD